MWTCWNRRSSSTKPAATTCAAKSTAPKPSITPSIPGLRNANLNQSFRDNFGIKLKTLCLSNCAARLQVDVGSYDNTEIDFVAKKGAEIQYFQVAIQLPENSNREIGNLVNLPDNYQKTVLTANRMDVGEVDGVKVVHVVDWLVGES